jgi:hypothetical protein
MTLTKYLLLFSAILALTAAMAASENDINGTWKGKYSGVGAELTLELKSAGAQVSGTMTDSTGQPKPISKRTLENGKIALTVPAEWQGMKITLVVNGKVDGDTMNLTVGTDDGSWTDEATVTKSK